MAETYLANLDAFLQVLVRDLLLARQERSDVAREERSEVAGAGLGVGNLGEGGLYYMRVPR